MSKSNEKWVSLSSLSLGQKGLIVAFSVDTAHGEYIQKMGLVPGELMEVVRIAPHEGTIEIKIRSYFASLRLEEADHIMVKPL